MKSPDILQPFMKHPQVICPRQSLNKNAVEDEKKILVERRRDERELPLLRTFAKFRRDTSNDERDLHGRKTKIHIPPGSINPSVQATKR